MILAKKEPFLDKARLNWFFSTDLNHLRIKQWTNEIFLFFHVFVSLMNARQPVSRVLSFKLVIYLGLSSRLNSSNQPRWLTKNCFRSKLDHAISIWSCSRWGFPCAFCYQKTGVLLPHLFTLALIRRFIFCGTVPGVSPARSYLAPCPYRARTFLSCILNKSD